MSRFSAYFSYFLILITNIILIAYTFPQIALNYRLKSGTGISDAMLLGMFNMSGLGFLFVYTARMPLIYKIMSPISMMAVIILIIQRIYYDGRLKTKFLRIFLINIFALLAIVPLAFLWPRYIAIFTGWMSFAFQFVYQIPQIIKIMRTRSTYGFSFMSVTMQTLGYLCELIAALLLKLPLPVVANDIRAIVMYFAFVLLFLKFQNNGEKRKTIVR